MERIGNMFAWVQMVTTFLVLTSKEFNLGIMWMLRFMIQIYDNSVY